MSGRDTRGEFARGACPSLLEPMETGDGLLVRIVPAGPMKLKALAGLCTAARTHGNGTMEISARGNLQIRGLEPNTAPLLADRLVALGIDSGDGVPVLADPLPGDPSALIDANALATELRRVLAASRLVLAPKVSVIVDGGGRLHLDALTADIRVRAVSAADGPRLHVALGGDGATATPLGTVTPDEACDAVSCLLAVIAAHGPGARGADVLQSRGLAAFRNALQARIELEPPPPTRLPVAMVGTHSLEGDLYAVGIGLAFGHTQAHTLKALTEIARVHNALWAMPAPDRTLLLGPFQRTSVKTIRDEARRLDFAVVAADPRRRIVACPGAPSCGSGLIASRRLAAEIAEEAEFAGVGIALHVSGCAKGCAHPFPAPLTVIGTAKGAGLVRHSTARATPSHYVNEADVAAAVDAFSVCEPSDA
ncbi:precorrin-3B synthase [Methyloceanibacter superfactus]|jgi:precorrin-3B synthase|nr:precorrin-3B synthase [Methyloceanibacter superfactus]